MKKVCVFLAEGFEEVEALTTVDLLRRAKVYVDTVSITGDYVVRGSNGITVQTEDLFEKVDFSEFDMVVLPGGMPGTKYLREHDGVKAVVKEFADAGKLVAAICAAPMVLSDLDLLKGKKATCYPACEPDVLGAIHTHAPVAVDGNIVTGQGVGAAIEFALKLIEKLESEEIAEEIAESIVYR